MHFTGQSGLPPALRSKSLFVPLGSTTVEERVSPLCRLLLCSLDAGCAGFYAGGRHGVARGGACAASGGVGLADAVPARGGLR